MAEQAEACLFRSCKELDSENASISANIKAVGLFPDRNRSDADSPKSFVLNTESQLESDFFIIITTQVRYFTATVILS